MGGGLSHFAGAGTVRRLVSSAGLPLEVDDDISHDQLRDPGKAPPLSAYTKAYDAPGFFTGVRSSVTIHKPAGLVYQSLSTNLHHVFSPMTVCDDTIEEDDGQGNQTLFRVIRVPFRVVFVSGNLKLRFHVQQSQKDGKIDFVNTKEGRLITRLLATFDIQAQSDQETTVCLDARIQAKQLPPPPFRGMVKAIMVSKIDQCMLDLMRFHGQGEDSQADAVSATDGSNMKAEAPSATVSMSTSPILADLPRKSFSEPTLNSTQPTGMTDSAPANKGVQQPVERQRHKDEGRFL